MSAPTLSRRDMLVAAGAALAASGADAAAQTAPPAAAGTAPVREMRLSAHAHTATFADGAAPSRFFRLVDSAQSRPAGSALPPIPVIRAAEGERLAFRFDNALPEPFRLHLRGMRGLASLGGTVEAEASGAPGGEASFVAGQPGTFFLSPILPLHASEQQARGLQAVLVVEERTPPPVDHDLVLVLSDARFGPDGALAGDFSAALDVGRMGRLGNRLVANGAPAPLRFAARPNARIRLRLVNGANARAFPLTAANLRAEVIAIDSTPCTPFDPLKRTVALTPGTRVEMLLEAPGKAGETGRIEARTGQGLPILDLMAEGEPLPARPAFAGLPDPGLPPAIRLQDAVRAELVIAGGLPRDGQTPDAAALARLLPDPAKAYRLSAGAGGPPVGGTAGRPLLTARRGQEIVLALTNRTDWPQVIAVHGHSFRLLHPFDDGWEPYWLDSIQIGPGTTARIAFHAGPPGRWLIRSAIAEHLAGGVLTTFQVI